MVHLHEFHWDRQTKDVQDKQFQSTSVPGSKVLQLGLLQEISFAFEVFQYISNGKALSLQSFGANELKSLGTSQTSATSICVINHI